MDQSSFWWLATGVLVAVELTTGTIYLLMLAVGTAAAAIAAHLGLAMSPQIVVAALIGFGCVASLYSYRKTHPSHRHHQPNDITNDLDAGQAVLVEESEPPTDGAKVKYRGSVWIAVLADGQTPAPGHYLVKRVDGARLIVVPSPRPNLSHGPTT